MSNPKEPHYFSRFTKYDRLGKWYESIFDGSDNYKAIGEGSTSYTNPNRICVTAQRIHQVLPECRLVYMVRHPIKRLESDWKMRSFEGRSIGDINEESEIDASLINFGLYWKNISHYRSLFADEQILVVFLEDFAANPLQQLKRVFNHIRVDDTFIPQDPEKPRYASKNFRHDGKIVSLLRGIPGFKQIRNALPNTSVSLAKQYLTQQTNYAIQWDLLTLQAVMAHFREDSRLLLEYCQKPADFWIFDAENWINQINS